MPGANEQANCIAAPKPRSEHNRLVSGKGSPQCGISIRQMSALGLGCVETPRERRHKVVEVGEAR
jgi:hypothetical protein